MDDPDQSHVWRGEFVTVTVPPFHLCPKETVRYSLFTEAGICSHIPPPVVEIEEPGTDSESPFIDPVIGENLSLALTAAITALGQISPMSGEVRPAKPTREIPGPKPRPGALFPFEARMESDPEFQEIKRRVAGVRLIF
jgi:hypothetical protein